MTSWMDELEVAAAELARLLAECDERYWERRIAMALAGIRANRLGGVSQVLGTFGGEGTLSDLELIPGARRDDPERHARANARLEVLRPRVFELADRIANATSRY